MKQSPSVANCCRCSPRGARRILPSRSARTTAVPRERPARSKGPWGIGLLVWLLVDFAAHHALSRIMIGMSVVVLPGRMTLAETMLTGRWVTAEIRGAQAGADQVRLMIRSEGELQKRGRPGVTPSCGPVIDQLV